MNKIFFDEKINNGLKNIGSLCFFLNKESNINYLKFLNDNIPKFCLDMPINEKLWYYVNNIKEKQLCIICENRSIYISFNKGYRNTCNKIECYSENRKLTNMKNYGVDNPMKSEEIVAKGQLTVLERYNGKHYMYNENVRRKFENIWKNKTQEEKNELQKKKNYTFSLKLNEEREAMYKKRGEEFSKYYAENREEMNKKKEETKIKNYGSIENYNKMVANSTKETSLQRYGVEHFMTSPEIINKRISSYKKKLENIVKSLLDNNYEYISHDMNKNKTDSIIQIFHKSCNQPFSIYRQFLYKRSEENKEICIHCNPPLVGKSQMEIDLGNFISDNYHDEIRLNYKIGTLELDIYLPDLNLAFEFNGSYWHSDVYKDQYFHLNKTLKCRESNIELIHVYEKDWVIKEIIIKNLILKLININEFSFEIKLITENDCFLFINENYIEEYIKSDINIGLFIDNILSSIMSFNKIENDVYQIENFNFYKADELIQYFISNYNPYNLEYLSNNNWIEHLCFKRLSFTKNLVVEPINVLIKTGKIHNNMWNLGYTRYSKVIRELDKYSML